MWGFKPEFTRGRLLLAVACVLVSAAFTTSAQAQQGQQTTEITVAVNKSKIMTSREEYAEISVGNPEIADVVPLTENRFYILGKSIGSTNVILRGADDEILDIFDVAVGYDIQSLKRAIYEIAPNQPVEVRTAGGAIVLTGAVESGDMAGKIARLADGYAPNRVNNMLSVSGTQQVLLNVRFAEVARSALKDLGVNLEATIFASDDVITLGSGQGVNPEAFGTLGSVTTFSDGSMLDAAIDALETKGMIRTLAEPNLVALSGDTASFLAGGEFPIPVAQESDSDSATITVEFKEFGVGLAFTPTVFGQEAINLEVDAEVSSIDPSVSVQTGVITVPGLKVRRARTTVELLDGQSFAIAGLIQDDFESAVRQIPGLGNVPILGALFRSNNFERRQTELVLIITVHLVQPTMMDRLAAPTDFFVPPNEDDFWLYGMVEELAGYGDDDYRRVVRGYFDAAAGVDGDYGYATP